MTPSLPYDEQIVPWEGDGPSQGIGGEESSQLYGEQSAVAVAWSLQPVRLVSIDQPTHAVDRAGPVLMTTQEIDYGEAPEIAIWTQRDPSTHQNTLVIVSDVQLGAPAIETGDPGALGLA